ncbi:MAG: hypothetical protein Q8O43_08210, partial [Dehalococcoidia bacterium]|nr:hypothetical protein [Dehalococcoidia bacterium]
HHIKVFIIVIPKKVTPGRDELNESITDVLNDILPDASVGVSQQPTDGISYLFYSFRRKRRGIEP